MKVPFVDLSPQYQEVKAELQDDFDRVFAAQHFILGNEVDEFEKEFAAYIGSKYCVGVGSGTDALILALKAMGVGENDEVILPTHTFVATALAVIEAGGTPVFVDVDEATLQMDVNAVAAAINNNTKVILPVHLYGSMVPMDQLMQLAEKHGIQILEDACQAHGATYSGKKAGTFGNMAAFSFYPGKNLGAYGDAGAIVTNDPELYEQAKLLHNYGQKKKYHHEMLGKNSRLDELQAAFLRTKLPHLDSWNQQRKYIAQKYDVALGEYRLSIPDEIESVYHLYVIQHPERDELQAYLQENGVDTLIHYPIPLHMQQCFSYMNHSPEEFPVAQKYTARILSLPIYPGMTDEQIAYVIELIQSFENEK
ncbi:DegT/DnrJ/EryC1/StrS family aminotransferase [Candidatus Woesebacteria bacterium]|nr:DegT/DnrJ/EryC1/StrS family aminotransferase [Candidatus Woesebacteria bacterium]MCD8506845.1 DegT/DnrJ/EryC1/StrS family aminotransferase [Candidatus Woesebacteria bacterium]MCD8527536.1 DegT/DnrJ/EryC1/StrS family aminotransferase [Candidatus Woesebacteria bacterium]MCD8546276.1 DegT/DnrJ/EryC1/StrS family aminotransferase [Candidatus Woesebacteria bacterium]